MSEFRGTQGPWAYDPSGPVMAGYSQPFGVHQLGKPNLVGGCFGDVAGGIDVAEANARLIAAAPDLLEACQAFMARYQNHMVNADLLFSDVAQQSRAAIAKALGQPQ